jgi:hypothetical protein
MISEEKRTNAIKAIQSVVIKARLLAYEGADHKKIASILDSTEYLVGMLYDARDMTATFRAVVDFATRHGCGIALTQFDSD